MAVRYIVLDGGRVVIEKWVGKVSHAELINHEKEQLNDQSIAPGAIAIADGRQAVFQTTLDSVHELTDVYADPNNKTSISRYALLVRSDTWKRAKVFEAEAKKHGVTIITFHALDTACTWLGLDAKKILEDIESIVI